MAELQFSAPLAAFDGEEWNEFHEFQTACDLQNSNNVKCEAGNGTDGKTGSEVDNNFEETFSGSLEDLVNTFDEKITKCFHNYQENVEQLAPVQVRTQEEILKDCQ